ncbi:venom allergen 5 [Plakobranchus ocellatus]|uniref:Venom allergen 5 n=1 Tax=Plakobranchus ocellatus TaxID=259542 RepID=A0AAV4BKQ8_9GAST|nr:venom allergen 5 [Plakobranchus ocellatus]
MALRVHPLIAIGLILCAFLASTRALTQDEKDFIVEKHNEYRREERTSLPDLVWDESLAKEAQAWANSCNDWHQEQDWGENIGYDDNISTETYSEALEKTLKIWMDEGDLNRDGSFRCCSATEQDCCNYSQRHKHGSIIRDEGSKPQVLCRIAAAAATLTRVNQSEMTPKSHSAPN